jgi:hypothetical protein
MALMLSGILDGIQRSEMLLRPSIIFSMLHCLRSFDLPGLIFYLPVDHRYCTQAIITVVLSSIAFDHSIFLDLSSIFVLIIDVVLKRGPGIEPAGLIFWVFVITYIHNCIWWFHQLGGSLDISVGPPDLTGFHQIWQNCHFYFWNLVLGHHWAFSHYHMAAHDWATWHPTIGPCQPPAQSPSTTTYGLPPQLPYHPSMLAFHFMYDLPCGCKDCYMEIFHWSMD